MLAIDSQQSLCMTKAVRIANGDLSSLSEVD